MNIPFELGKEYSFGELASSVGSKSTQGGILWRPDRSNSSSGVGYMIVTSGGRHQKTSRYFDQRNPDGSWFYFGQNNLDSYGNKLLKEGSLSVLLFTTREPSVAEVKMRGSHAKRYRYVGPFNVTGYHLLEDMNKQKLRFHLFPSSNSPHHTSNNNIENFVVEESLVEIRKRLIGNKDKGIKGRTSAGEYFRRSADVKKYTLKRAHGQCEQCGKNAPFNDGKGNPFLEVHHILRLADDGPDEPQNVAALCPNWHREAHYGSDVSGLQKELLKKIGVIELGIA